VGQLFVVVFRSLKESINLDLILDQRSSKSDPILYSEISVKLTGKAEEKLIGKFFWPFFYFFDNFGH
jgi:hypothetical protein